LCRPPILVYGDIENRSGGQEIDLVQFAQIPAVMFLENRIRFSHFKLLSGFLLQITDLGHKGMRPGRGPLSTGYPIMNLRNSFIASQPKLNVIGSALGYRSV
jgi:hypothetical protein